MSRKQPDKEPQRATPVNRWPAQTVQRVEASLRREDRLPDREASKIDVTELIARRGS